MRGESDREMVGALTIFPLANLRDSIQIRNICPVRIGVLISSVEDHSETPIISNTMIKRSKVLKGDLKPEQEKTAN